MGVCKATSVLLSRMLITAMYLPFTTFPELDYFDAIFSFKLHQNTAFLSFPCFDALTI